MAPNPMSRILTPRHGQRFVLALTSDGQPQGWRLYDNKYMAGTTDGGKDAAPVMSCVFNGEDQITLSIAEPKQVSMQFRVLCIETSYGLNHFRSLWTSLVAWSLFLNLVLVWIASANAWMSPSAVPWFIYVLFLWRKLFL